MVVYLENIVNEYESLVDLNDISIILSNNDKIHFRFKMENLPHLLGFQHVTDIPLFYKYSENQIYANQLLKAIRHGSIKQNEIDSSKLFKEVYDKRMKYFTYDRIYNMLLNGNISSFNPKKIKHFDTRLDKIDYIMWENFNGGYSHLGLGFSIKGNKGHPNTFFYRDNRDYVENQEMHTKLTLNIARPVNQENKLFKIYWENIYDSLTDNTHYKKLKKHADQAGCDIKDITEESISLLDYKNKDKDFISREFKLLTMAKINKIYEPYFLEKDSKFKWTNKEKQFIFNTIKEKNKDLFPNEVSVLLNDFRQRL